MCTIGLRNAMKATQVKREIKGPLDTLQPGSIPDEQLCLNPLSFQLLPGELDGTRGKVHTGHPPTRARQGDHIRAGTTANVDGTTGLLLLQKLEQFGRA